MMVGKNDLRVALQLRTFEELQLGQKLRCKGGLQWAKTG